MFERIRRWWKRVGLEVSYKDRFEWVKKLMEEVRVMVNSPLVKQELPEAAERFKYLESRGVVFGPSINDLGEFTFVSWADSPEIKKDTLKIIPILPSDASLGEWPDWVQKNVSLAGYLAVDQAIVLNMASPETVLFMASSLLHEAGHAMRAESEERILEQAALRDPQAKSPEELAMWLFDCKLTMLLGGEAFRACMVADINAIVQRFLQDASFCLIEFKSGAPMDLCYGSVRNERCLNRRMFLYSVFCHFCALTNSLGPAVAYDYQLGLMEWILQQLNKEKGTPGNPGK